MLLADYLRAVSATELPLHDSLELILYHLLAQWRYPVYEHCALKMVELMLHDSCQITFHPLIVLLQGLVKICHMNACVACHLLVDAGYGQTSFFHGLGVGVFVNLDNMRIDEYMAVALILRHVVTEHVKVDDHNPNVAPYLWSSKANALACLKSLVHILYEFLQSLIVWRDILGHLSQNRLPIYINR